MKITLNKEDFKRQLAKNAVYCIPKGLPIYNNVICSIKENNILEIKSSNGEIEITTRVSILDIQGDLESFCFSPSILLSLLNNIDNPIITLEAKQGVVELVYGKNKAKFDRESVDDFPTIRETELVAEFKTDKDFFNEIFVANRFSSDDKIRPILCSVLVEINQSSVDLVATTGYTLYKNTLATSENTQNQIILDKNSLIFLAKTINSQEIDEISIYSNCIRMNSEDTSWIVLTKEGRFPNWKAIIPNDLTQSIQLDKNVILSSLRRLKTMCLVKGAVIKFEILDSNIKLSFTDGVFNNSIEEDIEYEYKNGNNLCMGLNIDFFIQCLSSISTDTCVISYIDSTKALVVKEKDNEEKLMLLMPCNIN